MLGLDGLKFENPETEVPPATGGATNTTTGSTNTTTGSSDTDEGDTSLPLSTGTPEVSDEDLIYGLIDDFPALWPADTLFAFEPEAGESPYYFAYIPSEHTLATYQLGAGRDLMGKRSWAPDISWTHLVVLPSELGPVVIGYDALTGILERASAFKADGSFTSRRESGNLHTHLMLVLLENTRVLFGYDSTSGFYRAVPATPEDEITVRSGEVLPGWTDVAFVRYEDEPTVAFYSSATGEFAFYHFPDGATEIALVKEGTLPSEGALVGMPTAFSTFIGVYGASGGDFDLWSQFESGFGGAAGVPEIDGRDLRRGLSLISALTLHEQLAIFSFGDGVLAVNFPLWSKEESIIR